MKKAIKAVGGWGVALVILAALIFAFVGVGYTLFGDEWRAESNRHAYDEGYEKGFEEGYDLGYADAMEAIE